MPSKRFLVPGTAFRYLTQTFLVRYFENEITKGTDDLKGSFFWLLALLALPGVFIPWFRVFDWHIIELVYGAEGLREVSRSDKCFYIAVSMIGSGLLSALTWTSLLPDARDGIILGALPLRPRQIILAKLAALLLYLTLVAVATHSVAALFFGLFLSDDQPFVFMVRSVVGHFVSASLATLTVCLVVCALQGVSMGILGARAYRRAATFLQMGFVAVVALGIAYLPAVTTHVVPALRSPSEDTTWVLRWPFVWFVGVYEVIVGTSDPLLQDMAVQGLLLFGAALFTTCITFPLAYHRGMSSVTEYGGPRYFPRWLRGARLAGRAAATSMPSQAAAEFFMLTLSRVERQRFVVAAAAGLGLASLLPSLELYSNTTLPGRWVLAVPIVIECALLIGLRVAAALPGDTRAGWLFEAIHVDRVHARRALERIFHVFVILPVTLLTAGAYSGTWGVDVGLTHAAYVMSTGVLIAQGLLFKPMRMPCGALWRGSGFDSAGQWPWLAGIAALILLGVPMLEIALLGGGLWRFLFPVAAFLAAIALRRLSVATLRSSPADDEDASPAEGLLGLQ